MSFSHLDKDETTVGPDSLINKCQNLDALENEIEQAQKELQERKRRLFETNLQMEIWRERAKKWKVFLAELAELAKKDDSPAVIENKKAVIEEHVNLNVEDENAEKTIIAASKLITNLEAEQEEKEEIEQTSRRTRGRKPVRETTTSGAEPELMKTLANLKKVEVITASPNDPSFADKLREIKDNIKKLIEMGSYHVKVGTLAHRLQTKWAKQDKTKYPESMAVYDETMRLINEAKGQAGGFSPRTAGRSLKKWCRQCRHYHKWCRHCGQYH
jgi:hypothetical protein